MKTTILFLISFQLLFFHISGQECNDTLLLDDFSLTNNWNMEGDVSVIGGKCAFSAVYGGSQNRVFQTLNRPLSDTYWKAECDFVLENTNPAGYGAGGVIMALTAGELDFMSLDASNNYTETDQDGISVVLTSNSAYDNNINNWFFIIESKKGTIREFNTSSIIDANTSISTYFIRLERTEIGMTQLSIYSDSNFVDHIAGSPVIFAIDESISGLNTIQHGGITPGDNHRLLNGFVDNDHICDDVIITAGVTEIERNFSDYLNVYPNPSNNLIRINFNNDFMNQEDIYYSIVGLDGSLISQNKLNSNYQIDISAISNGFFILKVNDSNNAYYTKFQKIH